MNNTRIQSLHSCLSELIGELIVDRQALISARKNGVPFSAKTCTAYNSIISGLIDFRSLLGRGPARIASKRGEPELSNAWESNKNIIRCYIGYLYTIDACKQELEESLEYAERLLAREEEVKGLACSSVETFSKKAKALREEFESLRSLLATVINLKNLSKNP